METFESTKEQTHVENQIMKMLLVVIIGALALLLVSSYFEDRIQSNEEKAIAMLRDIIGMQAQFSSVMEIDVDNDERGEYGFIGDLAGIYNPESTLPPLIAEGEFSEIGSQTIFTNAGYCFSMYLPDAQGHPVRENGMQRPPCDTALSEKFWACYAWPVEYGCTGRRSFVATQQGTLLVYSNQTGTPFTGVRHIPVPEAVAAISLDNPLGSIVTDPDVPVHGWTQHKWR